jgi:hypothetical protein
MRLPCIPILLTLAAHFAVGQVRIRSDQKLSEESMAVWNGIKTSLQEEAGEVFFQSCLRDSVFPGGARGVRVFSGTVKSSRPVEHPGELLLAIADSNAAEVTLKLDDPLQGPVTPGSRVAFAGIVTGYRKEPFMLTLEVRGGRTFALVLVAGASDEAASFPMPSLQLNYRSRLSTGFLRMSLDGFPMHRFTVNDGAAEMEMEGVQLQRFLASAGWYGPVQYSVEVDGPASAVTLAGPPSFERQAWLVPISKQAASLLVVKADGTLIQKVEGIQRIRVSEK